MEIIKRMSMKKVNDHIEVIITNTISISQIEQRKGQLKQAVKSIESQIRVLESRKKEHEEELNNLIIVTESE